MRRPEVRRYRSGWRLVREGVPFGPSFENKHEAIRHRLDLAELERIAAERRSGFAAALESVISRIGGRR